MARKRLLKKVVDLTLVKRRGQAVVVENYVYDGDQLVAEMNAPGAFSMSTSTAVLWIRCSPIRRYSSESSGHWKMAQEPLGM